MIIILLAFLGLRPVMYDSTYGPSGYQPGHMGPGMMHNPAYNYSYGSGMMGDMMALYYPGATPINQEEARQKMEDFAKQYGSNLEVDDFMAFSSNYYAVLKDTDSNQSIAEILVDRYSGSVYPEPGPNMMWNTRFGAGRMKAEGADYDLAGAKKLAEIFLTGYLPGAQITESKQMPGYYTYDFGRQDIEGMLSVNAYSGQIWVHTWHGPYLGGFNATT
ncbi:MAG: peptidase M4 [Methanosarcina sp.]|nr:peptidase M4 [Methanosarcina sp.]MDD4522665.1 peptidase M4 [Methanosarcina sp.]